MSCIWSFHLWSNYNTPINTSNTQSTITKTWIQMLKWRSDFVLWNSTENGVDYALISIINISSHFSIVFMEHAGGQIHYARRVTKGRHHYHTDKSHTTKHINGQCMIIPYVVDGHFRTAYIFSQQSNQNQPNRHTMLLINCMYFSEVYREHNSIYIPFQFHLYISHPLSTIISSPSSSHV